MSPEVAMLRGELVTLRPVREADLDGLYDAHIAIRQPRRLLPARRHVRAALRRDFAENGFWGRDEGTLLIWTPDDEIAGHIEFFKPVSYWDAFELSYQLYDDRFAGPAT